MNIDGTPKVNGFSGFTPQTDQKFFGEHEPLFNQMHTTTLMPAPSSSYKEPAYSSEQPSSSSDEAKPKELLGSNSFGVPRMTNGNSKQKPEELTLKDIEISSTGPGGVDSPGLYTKVLILKPTLMNFQAYLLPCSSFRQW